MTKKQSTRRKAKTSPSAPAQPIATAAATTALPVQELIDRIFNIVCRVAVYAHAAEHIDNDEAEHIQQEAKGSLSTALGEVHRDLLDIVNRLQDLPEARS
jgi:hypothetical protein